MKKNITAIITRTKNRPLTLERAIQSVLQQTNQNWTHIIVNDGGIPSLVDNLYNKYKKEYIGRCEIIHNCTSVGMEAASNIGIRNSQSDYILIHDDDDTLEKNFLQLTTKTLEECKLPSVRGVVSHTNYVWEEIRKNKIKFRYSQPHNKNLNSISLQQICTVNRFMPISFLYKRSVHKEIGLFDENLPVCGDWEFNIRFLRKYDIVVIPKLLANHHKRVEMNSYYANSMTSQHADHEFYRSLILNKYARKDLDSGNMSLSHLLSLGEVNYQASIRPSSYIFKFRNFFRNKLVFTLSKILK